MDMAALLKRYRITDGAKFRLKDHDPGDDGGIKLCKEDAQQQLQDDIVRLSALQEKLYAQNRWAVLAVFQAMDAAGKDSAIKHVMSGVNPQGCEVYSFKQPSAEELDHDFLWRVARRTPERGRIGIFNRSHYEEVLVVRVHPEFLEHEQLPESQRSADFWRQRFDNIRGFERHLAQNGTAICKFFLNVSKKEQKKRFLARIEDPAKNWIFSLVDVAERNRWPAYMAAYEDAIRNTATAEAPWYVVPADRKWFTRLIVAAALIETINRLRPDFPQLSDAARKELKKVRAALEAE
jgi:PPK2 family polyphosphate:nucleotide phosphotransferase